MRAWIASIMIACGDSEHVGATSWDEPTLVMRLPGDDPTLTQDLLELYIDGDGDTILVSMRPTIEAPWSAFAVVAELVDASGLESTPEISADGLVLTFSSTRTGGAGGLDHWMSTRATRSAPWGQPVVLADLSSADDDFSASLSADGLAVVFARPSGGRDLFASSRATTAGMWAQPTEIDELNTPLDDSEPHFTADALGVVFASTRSGDHDLYMGRRAARDQPFSVEPLPAIINTEAPESDPWISPDGRQLFFMRGDELWVSTR